jgi:hypothetical protein
MKDLDQDFKNPPQRPAARALDFYDNLVGKQGWDLKSRVLGMGRLLKLTFFCLVGLVSRSEKVVFGADE